MQTPVLLQDPKDPQSILAGARIIRQAIEIALQVNQGTIIGRHGTIEFNLMYSHQ